MTFARNASVNGQWMLDGALDKPPLSIYASALAMRLFAVTADDTGVLDLDIYHGEFASRLPNIFASIILVAVTIRLTRELYDNPPIALLAGALLTLSSYRIAFSATAFTDILMITLSMTSLLFIIRRHWGVSGLFFALALASKLQAIFFLPLLIAVIWLRGHLAWGVITRFLLFTLIGVVAFILWDSTRPEESVFALAFANNLSDISSTSPVDTIPDQVIRWLNFGEHIFGSAVLTTVVLLASLLSLKTKNVQTTRINRFIFLWMIGYVSIHLIANLNVFDRYLLIILPFICILGAYGSWQFWQWQPVQSSFAKYVLAGACLIALALSAWIASEQFIGIGGDDGKHAEIDDLANYLNEKPVATVIYDHWLGWELGYYMGQWNDKRRVYYPTPEEMIRGAQALDEPQPRYFPAPADAEITVWLNGFRDADFRVSEDYRNEGFLVYEIVPPD